MNASQSEPASQTGTGWTVFAGGVISRSIELDIDEMYDDPSGGNYVKNNFNGTGQPSKQAQNEMLKEYKKIMEKMGMPATMNTETSKQNTLSDETASTISSISSLTSENYKKKNKKNKKK